MTEFESPFSAIIHGQVQGTIISRDNDKKFALIESMEPEAAIHWLAVTFEDGFFTEELEQNNRGRFLELIDYAINQAKELSQEYPVLENGFTIKFHVGSFETVQHPKLHILSIE